MTPVLRGASPLRLVLLTLALVLFWVWGGASFLSDGEKRVYRKVQDGQRFLWNALALRGSAGDPVSDPGKSGFIGVEWSLLTTTLGSLESKRCSTDPLWAVQVLRWFDRLGLKEGDRVVVLSSASFPGMLFSVLAAAESRGLRIDLAVSLGASTWGANRPEAPWPVLAELLRGGGYIATEPLFYTLGGGAENGGGLPDEAVALLENSTRGRELFRPGSLHAVVERKMALIMASGDARPVKLVVDVGGAAANLGEDPAVLSLAPGLLFPRDDAGDGVVGLALKKGFPVLHLLNLRPLAEKVGIDFAARRPFFFAHSLPFARVYAVLGVALFVGVLAAHRRWTWED